MTVLVIIQGIMGWMMVKSGLIDLPHVSHIRLMMHLGLAFFLFGYTWWTVLTVVNPDCKPMAIRVRKGTQILLGIIVLQIIYGAFSAGLKAGYIMNTFPKMGDTWIPDGLMILSPFWHNFIHNPMMVQFIHRGLAWILLVGILLLCGYLMFRQSLSWFQRRSVIFLGGSLVLQFILGVITLVYHVPLHAAVAHQLMGLLVFIAILTVYFGMRLESTGV
jgi:cytochrome c oxidase assembly protein subunit 15